ncbi:MAG: hypothetical protein K2J76_00945, partial [Oscillospiraceae bacterium]|nr:hypothetical protein [Oscillospiraceae bacterium]
CVSVNAYADTLAERDGLKYLVSDSGTESLYSGWTKKGGDRYYYKNGVMKKNCWVTSKGVRKYYLQADGKAATGKVTIQGVEYEFDENGAIVPDAWGLTLTAKDVTLSGCTVVFVQSGGNPTGELQTGSYYSLERYENGKWATVEMLPQKYDVAWPAISYPIFKNDSSEFNVEWQSLYGKLPAGKYRVGKDVMDFRKAADYDTKMYYAYFEIADEWGLTLTAKDVTPTGCTVVFTQSGGNPTGELNTGVYYELEQYKNGKWTAVKTLRDDIGWLDVALIIKENDSTEIGAGWSERYGELPAGKYRIGKDVDDWRAPGDYDTKMYYAYFEIADEWGLTLTAKDVTPTGCTVMFYKSGGNPTGELHAGSDYKLERYENGKWEAVKMLPQKYDVAWT